MYYFFCTSPCQQLVRLCPNRTPYNYMRFFFKNNYALNFSFSKTPLICTCNKIFDVSFGWTIGRCCSDWFSHIVMVSFLQWYFYFRFDDNKKLQNPFFGTCENRIKMGTRGRTRDYYTWVSFVSVHLCEFCLCTDCEL